jgi:hypothetical protein
MTFVGCIRRIEVETTSRNVRAFVGQTSHGHVECYDKTNEKDIFFRTHTINAIFHVRFSFSHVFCCQMCVRTCVNRSSADLFFFEP